MSKPMPPITTSSSAHDLPMRLNQSNNANPQMIDCLNHKSNGYYFNSHRNKKTPTVDNHRNSIYPKMNFTSSVMTAASTLPAKVTDNLSMKLDTDTTKTSKYMDSRIEQNDDRCSMQNMVTQNFNSFGPMGAMPSQNSLNNCTLNSIQSTSHENQQRLQFQQPPSITPSTAAAAAPSTITYSSNSNTSQMQMQTLNSQSNQQMQSQHQHQQQHILDTKVTDQTHKNDHIYFSLVRSLLLLCY